MTHDPLFTICITTYNRQHCLGQAIRSATNQSYKNIEVLVIDDCSTDETPRVIQEYLSQDQRIQYFRHEVNQGLAQARNTAIEHAKGKYFSFCDDDDTWTPDFVSSFIEVAEKYSLKHCYCAGNYHITNNTKVQHIPEFSGALLDYLKAGYTPPVASQCYPTQLLKDVSGYNTQIKSGVDHDLWITLSLHGAKIVSVPKALAHINANSNEQRMTTNYQKRKTHIANSLKTWHPQLIEIGGDQFTEDFYHAYMSYLDYTEMKHSLLEKKYHSILRMPFSSPYHKLMLKTIAGHLKRQAARNSSTINSIGPTFFWLSHRYPIHDEQ